MQSPTPFGRCSIVANFREFHFRDCLKTLDNLKPKASRPAKWSKRCSLWARWTTKMYAPGSTERLFRRSLRNCLKSDSSSTPPVNLAGMRNTNSAKQELLSSPWKQPVELRHEHVRDFSDSFSTTLAE